MDPAERARIMAALESQGAIHSRQFVQMVADGIREHELSLDKARKYEAQRRSASIRGATDPVGRPFVRSLLRDDGWWTYSAKTIGPVEQRIIAVTARNSADRGARRAKQMEDVTDLLERHNATLWELPIEEYLEVMNAVA